MLRAAAVDIGTNTVLLTIAERRGPLVVPLCERAAITRLGAGVDRTRSISADACTRTLACLSEYGELIRLHGADFVDAVGTSALRDAGSDPHFIGLAQQALGCRPRVLSGAEEAELTFHGALSGLALQGEVLVFDVGGGSTEIASGSAAGPARVASAVSLDLGSVRLFERHIRSDPPTREEMLAVRCAVRDALARAPMPSRDCELVGVAGTVTSLAALAGTAAPLHGALLARSAVDRLADELAELPLAQRLGLADLDPGRADVIVCGAAIVSEVMAWSGATALRVSDRGVRWGLLEHLLRSA